ncbi:hypothetical protein GMST_41840 [Geomonas silvestris]|uniref:YhdP central domain-containing protein n=1 Tax=Geomonas silvestris TaxID=2740184 RepID=A0A6V8MQH3_9BACT|nr:AsmA-like C-terminal domain-containing protein [Geomonas silvestris]GFO61859.1 hypothetical protein GMST_41840 [Geomonas silvestris]
MQLRRARAWVLPLIIAIISFVVVAGSLALRFLDLDTYKAEITAQVRTALKRDLRYQIGDFSFRYGPAFTFTGVTIKEKNGVDDFVTADRLTIRIALIPLLRRELVLSRMQLDHPKLILTRDRNGVFNISDLLERPKTESSAALKGLELKNAEISFADSAFSETPLVTELTRTDLYLSNLVRGKNCDFKLSGTLKYPTRKVPIFLAGVAKLAPEGSPFTQSELSGHAKLGALDATHFYPYFGRYLPFKSLSGDLELDAHIKGKLAAFKLKGNLQVSRLRLDYPQVFHALLTPKLVKANYELELTERDLNISAFKANVDGLAVQGSCKLSDLYSKDLRITAKATMGRFDLKNFRQYIPYGIIVKDTADFIEQKIAGGIYRLDEGRLDGRVSQILHMERGQNYNILTVKARVEEGVVNYGSGIPPFTGIKGQLELAGKDFTLRGMSGRFGSSPFTLEGRITDYPLEVPCRYLFAMNLQPNQSELAWFLGHGRGDKSTLSGGSTLKLIGEGTTSLYNLSGDWDLTQTSYSLPDLIAKPAGRHNTLSFRGSFDKEQFRLTGSHFALAPLSLSATAVSQYRGPISVDLRTNSFAVNEVAPLVPPARKYQPAGKLQAALQGKGATLEVASWSGDVSLAGFSFKPTEKMKPITGVNGTLRFAGDSVESSQIAGRLGSSSISGHGSVSNFKSPTVSVSFASPSLDLADLGFNAGKTQLRAERVQGTVSLTNDTLQIASLSGQLGRSTLQVKGSIQDLKHPHVDVTVNSPHLELEDLNPLFGSRQQGAEGKRFTMKAQVTAAEGRYRDIPFQHLKTLIQLEDKIVYLQPFEVWCLDGEITGKVRMDFGSNATRYQVSCNAQKVSADKLLHAFGVKKQQVVGALSLQSDLSAKGETAQELKQSALGSLKLRVEHGSIRKFSTLAKVFSILNVSQLVKGQLPDMVSGGMPFNKITGDFAVKDGIASTQNLYIDSNAMNISTVGKFDLPRNELDLTIGVQPLQTVDKVVSHIPIVGWILTGKDRSLITTYFEAKGPIEDPRVTAIPVKSLGKGVLNIFKRVFELPAKLFTDTGEVIIGK